MNCCKCPTQFLELPDDILGEPPAYGVWAQGVDPDHPDCFTRFVFFPKLLSAFRRNLPHVAQYDGSEVPVDTQPAGVDVFSMFLGVDELFKKLILGDSLDIEFSGVTDDTVTDAAWTIGIGGTDIAHTLTPPSQSRTGTGDQAWVWKLTVLLQAPDTVFVTGTLYKAGFANAVVTMRKEITGLDFSSSTPLVLTISNTGGTITYKYTRVVYYPNLP